MHSQSSGHSSDNDFQDDLSCTSYSSGWERSSTTDYFESSDTEQENDLWEPTDTEQENGDCGQAVIQKPKPFYTPVKRSKDGVKIFDMEYECKLVVLPNPYTKQFATTSDTRMDEDEETEEEQQDMDTAQPTDTANPWKKVEGTFSENPWEFLEKPPTPPPTLKFLTKPSERVHHHHHHPPPHQKIDNSNTNKLCKYKTECRMNRNNNCNMVHSLSDWKPKICRFNNGCRRKKSCAYYHTETPIAEFLKLMISTDNTIYAKNSSLYEKYLK